MNKNKILLPLLCAFGFMLATGCVPNDKMTSAPKRQIKSTVFNSVDISFTKGLKVSTDVYLNKKDADFMYIVFDNDTDAKINIQFAKTEGEAKLFFNGEEIYDFGVEAVEEKNDSVQITLLEGLNSFSLRGNDCDLKISLSSKDIKAGDIDYAGVMKPADNDMTE